MTVLKLRFKLNLVLSANGIGGSYSSTLIINLDLKPSHNLRTDAVLITFGKSKATK